MSISQDELKKIAEKLSKIPGDNGKLLGNITDIISYMDLLSEVDTTGVIPTVSVVDDIALLREDSISNPTGANAGEILSSSKQKIVSGQIVLPNIMS
jgi:aspartyl/glutamyl-tRNA(Asn/Gln) amidotransferase C subunit